MKKASAIMALILLAMPIIADAAVRKAARTTARTSAKVDYNCADFATRTQAEAFFIKSGGPKRDPYHLDADKDGLACENLK